MNFQTARQLKGQKDAKGYAIKQDIFLTFTEIAGVTFTQNQKQTCKCKATDDLGENHTVNFYGKIMPAPNMLGRRVVASVAAVDGDYGEIWQAFLKSGNVSQPPQNAQQAVLPPRQATNAPQGVQSNGKDGSICRQCAGKVMGMVFSGAGETIDIVPTIIKYAEPLAKWFETGEIPMSAAPEPNDLPPNFNEEEPPFDQKYGLEG